MVAFVFPYYTHPEMIPRDTSRARKGKKTLIEKGLLRFESKLVVCRWSPVQSVEKVLLSVMSMLAEPNTESPANVDAAKMWRENREDFKKIAHKHVRMTLEEDPPSESRNT